MKDERGRERADRQPAGARLVRGLLERATAGQEPGTEALLGAVPRMLFEARRRRAGRDALSASVRLCRWAIPRFAAAAVVLVAICTALLLSDRATTGDAATWDDVLVAGSGVSDELLIESMLDAESAP